jgi:3'-phosphoadenosine 5'-phosphosulfate sulfotransferase
MWNRIRSALARRWGRGWWRVRLLGSGTDEGEVESTRSAAARARFWEEFRDGQREAEARSTDERR